MLPAITALSILGLLFGLALAFVSIKFAVAEDPRLRKILEALPNLNCGACGQAGCHAFGERLLRAEVETCGCLAGGSETAHKLAAIMGVQSQKRAKKVAVLHCGASASQRPKISGYDGLAYCKAADLIQGGELACSYGCLGYGDCSRVCPVGAITMVNGLPKVDYSKCTGCGKCSGVCPKKLYTLEAHEKERPLVAVACSSLDKGGYVKKICEVGCIACRICEKACPGVFYVKDNLARIDYSKAIPETDWQTPIEKCPQDTIIKLINAL